MGAFVAVANKSDFGEPPRGGLSILATTSDECSLLALIGHLFLCRTCPLSGGKADMASTSQNVRYWPKADMANSLLRPFHLALVRRSGIPSVRRSSRIFDLHQTLQLTRMLTVPAAITTGAPVTICLRIWQGGKSPEPHHSKLRLAARRALTHLYLRRAKPGDTGDETACMPAMSHS